VAATSPIIHRLRKRHPLAQVLLDEVHEDDRVAHDDAGAGRPPPVGFHRAEAAAGVLPLRPAPARCAVALRARDGAGALRRGAGESAREPTFSQIDLRISRGFAFGGEKRSGEVFAQIFNLLDRFNAGTLDGAVTSRRFGEPFNQAGPPRTLEMGFKMAF
jgi:hypothetical protein